MSKGNKPQKNDKANMKPKKEVDKKTEPLTGFAALSKII